MAMRNGVAARCSSTQGSNVRHPGVQGGGEQAGVAIVEVGEVGPRWTVGRLPSPSMFRPNVCVLGVCESNAKCTPLRLVATAAWADQRSNPFAFRDGGLRSVTSW
jgi:hypothetical protein